MSVLLVSAGAYALMPMGALTLTAGPFPTSVTIQKVATLPLTGRVSSSPLPPMLFKPQHLAFTQRKAKVLQINKQYVLAFSLFMHGRLRSWLRPRRSRARICHTLQPGCHNREP